MESLIKSPNRSYIIIKEIGSGASGSVLQVQDQQDNTFYAMKKISKLRIYLARKEREVAEQMIHKLANVKNVTKYYEIFEDPSDIYHFYIRMEYCDCPSLYEEIYKQKIKFTLIEVIQIGIQIAKGIQELHKLNIVHRDIKPENIVSKLESQDTNCVQNKIKTYKLCDLGLSREINIRMTYQIGTPLYSAPEMVSENLYDEKVDVWAFGCIIYEMLTGQAMFEDYSIKEVEKKILGATAQSVEKLTEEFQNVAIKNLLRKTIREKSSRVSIKEVLEELEIEKQRIEINKQANQIKEKRAYCPSCEKQTFKMDSNFIQVQNDQQPQLIGKPLFSEGEFSPHFTENTQIISIQNTQIKVVVIGSTGTHEGKNENFLQKPAYSIMKILKIAALNVTDLFFENRCKCGHWESEHKM